MTQFREVEYAKERHRMAQGEYLRRWGWTQTCNTPGSFWLWKRDFADVDNAVLARWQAQKDECEAKGWTYTPSKPNPYGVITADTDLAVSMTARCLDERPEEAEDEDE